jgi:antitoxin (DNA-binding transcriptional repressor) of toxin-antitoxin stability system
VVGVLDRVPVHEISTYVLGLLDDAECGGEIVIARDGEPLAEIVATSDVAARRRAVRGVWRGMPSLSQEEFDACNDEIAREFGMIE